MTNFVSKFLYLSKLIILPAALVYMWYFIQTSPEYQYGGVYIIGTIISLAIVFSVLMSIRNRIVNKRKENDWRVKRLAEDALMVPMSQKEFEEALIYRIKLIATTLESKGDEYNTNKDMLHNFNTVARYTSLTPRLALWGMFMKHFVSIRDYVMSERDYTVAQLEEKFGDAINYLILLEMMTKKEKTFGQKLIKEANDKEKEIQEKLNVLDTSDDELEKERLTQSNDDK
jgi:hypothetical protein